MISKTFCPLAWNHAFVNQDGSFQLCCTSEEFNNKIRDENDEPIFITSGKTTEEVMNSPTMKNVRQKMLAGEWPTMCGRCKVTEKLAGTSRRNIEILNYENSIEEMVQSTKEDGSTTFKVTSLDYRLGNLCNLQCRMCNPRSSKMWIKDWNSLKSDSEKFSQEVMDSYLAFNWMESEDLVRDFEGKAPHLEHIHFAGGEPLLVQQMSRILERCVESGNAKNIILTYNTNLTLLPKKVLELWKHFKGVKILASIDAIGELNYYIRYPSSWELIEKNLRFIDEHHEEYNITECILSTTVQALNILHLPEIYAYLQSYQFIVKAPNLINLHFPYSFQTNVLPPGLKLLAIAQLQDIEKKYKSQLAPHYHYLIDNLKPIINFINASSGFDDGRFGQFRRFQEQFDELKSLSIENYCPEIASYFKSSDGSK